MPAPSRWSWPTATRRPSRIDLRLPGAAGRAALVLGVAGHALAGRALPHDRVVLGVLADVLAGGDADPTVPVTEQHVYDLERAAVISLLHHGADPAARRAHADDRKAAPQLMLDDVRFMLHDVLGETETYDDVLAGAAELCRDVIAPLNAPGDLAGAVWNDGAVTTPAGFPEAFRPFAEGGWVGLTAAPGVRRLGAAPPRRRGARGAALRREPVVLHLRRAHLGRVSRGRPARRRRAEGAPAAAPRAGHVDRHDVPHRGTRRHRPGADPHPRRAGRDRAATASPARRSSSPPASTT